MRSPARLRLASWISMALCSISLSAHAEVTASFNLPSQSLAESLKAIGAASNINVVVAPVLVDGRRAPALKAQLSTRAALVRLLEGTGLECHFVNEQTVVIREKTPVAGHVAPVGREDVRSADLAHLAQSTGTAVVAQSADGAGADEAAQALDEVVVTATRRSERLKDVAMGVSAVSGEDLMRRNERSFADYAAQIPGLSLQVSDAGVVRLVMRGINVGGEGATVATVIDDIPFSMTGSQSSGAFFGANFDTYDLQRIEALRGPQGTLYGATAEGGLIKFVTREPDLHRFEVQGGAGGERVRGGDAAMTGRGVVNLPLADGRAALRISGTLGDAAGWIDNTLTGQDDWNSTDRHSVHASLLLQPWEPLRIRASYFNQGLTAHGSGLDTLVVGAALNPLDPPANKFKQLAGDSFAQLGPSQLRSSLEVYALNVQYDFAAASLMSVTSYGESQFRSVGDSSSENFTPGVTLGDLFGNLVYGQPIALLSNSLQYLHKFNQEFRLTSRSGSSLAGRELDWQGGLFYTRERAVFDQGLSAASLTDLSLPLDPPTGGASLPSNLIEKSVFADFTYHLTPRLDFEIGGRHSRTEQWSQTRLICCVVFGPSFEFDRLSTSENKTTWSFAPRLHMGKDAVAYARIASGYRAGGPNIPTPTLPDPPLLRPDSTVNYELGIRADTFSRRLAVSLTGFLIDWKDVQITSFFQTSTGSVGIRGNSGRAESRGVEWDLQWRATDEFTLALVGAYTDAQLRGDAPGLGASDGDRLPWVPRLQTTLNADYRRHAFADFDILLGASYSHFGSQRTNFSPSTDFAEAHVLLPAYQTLKVQLGVENGRFGAQFFANNLTNERAIIGYRSQGGYGQSGIGRFIQPRTIGIQFDCHF